MKGVLKNGKKDWDKWVTGLKTVLTLTRGVTDVPLIYVIYDDGQNILNQLPADYPFDAKCIAMAQLMGPDFEADAMTVHLIIKPLDIGELAEQWILPGYAKENGREDFKILKAHYDSEGTNTRRVHDAVNWHKNLSYRNERAQRYRTCGTFLPTMANR